MRIIHNANFIGDKETRSKPDTRNYLVVIKEIHSRMSVTVPEIFIVRLYEQIELFIKLTQFLTPQKKIVL